MTSHPDQDTHDAIEAATGLNATTLQAQLADQGLTIVPAAGDVSVVGPAREGGVSGDQQRPCCTCGGISACLTCQDADARDACPGSGRRRRCGR